MLLSGAIRHLYQKMYGAHEDKTNTYRYDLDFIEEKNKTQSGSLPSSTTKDFSITVFLSSNLIFSSL
jgi:hypothetical protein